MELENSKRWYNKTGLVILLIIVFFPVGLYALWKNETIAKGVKIGVSVLIGIIVIVQFNKNEEPKLPVEINTTKESNLDQLKLFASRLRGGGFIKNVELVNQKGTITYVSDYDEYKRINPKSGITNELFNSYWSTGDAIEKALVGGTITLLTKADFINQIKILIPFKNKTFIIEVDKADFEKFIGKNLNEINPDTYIFSDIARREILNKFSRTE
jgi:hypothetical protein